MKQDKKRYLQYLPTTQRYMANVEKAIAGRNGGDIPNEYELQLQILAAQVDNYLRATESVQEKLIVINRFGNEDKNPMLKVQQDSIIQINNLCKFFGLNEYSVTRLNSKEIDTTEDFIDALVK